MPEPRRRSWTLLLTILITSLVSVPTSVWASHQFSDVPDSHTFHNAIAWMADNGITVGCNPPLSDRYCPDDVVTRGQMAAFLKRLAENTVVDANTLDGKESSEYLSIATAQRFDWFSSGNHILPATGNEIVETQINVPVAGHILVLGHAAVGNSMAVNSLFTLWAELDDGSCGIAGTTPDSSISGATTYSSVDAAGDQSSMTVNGLVAVSAGEHTVTMCGAHDSDDGEVFNASVVAQFIREGDTTDVASLSNSEIKDGPRS